MGLYSRYRKDALLRDLFTNSSMLLGGNLVASLLGLASLAVTARALGVEQFGMLVLITTYVLIVDALINFQSWQAIIRYGANRLEEQDRESFKSLVKFGFLLDGVTAAAGAMIAAAAAWPIGVWLGWQEHHVFLAAIYSATIVFHISGTPIAILRLFNRFGKTAIQPIYMAAFKLIGVSTAYAVGADLAGFLIVWALADIVGRLLLLYFALEELRIRNIHEVISARISRISTRFVGIWGFVITTNLNSSIRMASREADIMIVAALLGPSAVGLYKVAKQFTVIIQKTIDPLYQAIYPELAKLYTKGQVRQFVIFGLRSSVVGTIVASTIWLCFLFFGEYLVKWTVGPEYLDAMEVMLWYMAAAVVAAAAFPLQPAMLSMGRPHTTLLIHVVSTIGYFALLFPLVEKVGLAGAGIAYFTYYLIWTVLMIIAEARVLKRNW